MKYTVITGASSGIGYETALAFARRGKNLIVVARRAHKLEELKATIKSINSGLDVIVQTTDLSDTKQAHDLYQTLKVYEIETWINNAGLGDSSMIIDEDLDKVEQLLRVNIDSLTILSTLYARDYANIKGTQLINVSSALGYAISLGSVVYSASKYYVSAFTEGLARELKLQNAKLTAKILAPAMTETEFVDNANNVQNFDYRSTFDKFHTAKEMAGFMLDVYDSDKVIGLVDGKYEFGLRDQIYPILENF